MRTKFKVDNEYYENISSSNIHFNDCFPNNSRNVEVYGGSVSSRFFSNVNLDSLRINTTEFHHVVCIGDVKTIIIEANIDTLQIFGKFENLNIRGGIDLLVLHKEIGEIKNVHLLNRVSIWYGKIQNR